MMDSWKKEELLWIEREKGYLALLKRAHEVLGDFNVAAYRHGLQRAEVNTLVADLYEILK